MQRKINPSVHIICGKCGCATMFEFKLVLDGNDNGKIYPSVFLLCDNCSTITGLDEIIEDTTDWEQIGLTKNYDNE